MSAAAGCCPPCGTPAAPAAAGAATAAADARVAAITSRRSRRRRQKTKPSSATSAASAEPPAARTQRSPISAGRPCSHSASNTDCSAAPAGFADPLASATLACASAFAPSPPPEGSCPTSADVGSAGSLTASLAVAVGGSFDVSAMAAFAGSLTVSAAGLAGPFAASVSAAGRSADGLATSVAAGAADLSANSFSSFATCPCRSEMRALASLSARCCAATPSSSRCARLSGLVSGTRVPADEMLRSRRTSGVPRSAGRWARRAGRRGGGSAIGAGTSSSPATAVVCSGGAGSCGVAAGLGGCSTSGS